jgi:hypothetical protein
VDSKRRISSQVRRRPKIFTEAERWRLQIACQSLAPEQDSHVT